MKKSLGAAPRPPRKNRSNRHWIERHLSDPFVKAATAHGYRSRAAFKLIEIDDSERLLRPGQLVIDLGAAPGSWAQVVGERVLKPASSATSSATSSAIIALDILPMEPIERVTFIQGDFRETATAEVLGAALAGRAADVVLSDMSPNLSGISAADAARSADLWDLALEFSLQHLRPNGVFLVKAFQGTGFSQFVAVLKRHFIAVGSRKPAASRAESAEIYLLARGLKQRT